jgi:transcriptional regulator with XRE-family HTH domain
MRRSLWLNYILRNTCVSSFRVPLAPYAILCPVNLREGIRELRKHEGQSQQAFATSLNMSLRALQMYEGGKLPHPKQLLAITSAAERAGRADLVQVLRKYLYSGFGWNDPFTKPAAIDAIPEDEFENMVLSLVRYCLRWPGSKEFAAEILAVLDRMRQAAMPNEPGGLLAALSETQFETFRREAIDRGYAQITENGRLVWTAKGQQTDSAKSLSRTKKGSK